jgi:LacI family transcriptional regulator
MAHSPIRATLRDIARRAGCHYSAVSLALREHLRIPEATRLRIQEIAHQLGYQPDAMLAALCAYRDQKQTVNRRGWRDSACNRDYFDGVSSRAAERGYTLECFWLGKPGISVSGW